MKKIIEKLDKYEKRIVDYSDRGIEYDESVNRQDIIDKINELIDVLNKRRI